MVSVMENELKTFKAGVLAFLTENNRSGFTESQILTAYFGKPDNASESDKKAMKEILESLVLEKKIARNTLSTKSGVKTYYKAP